MNVIPYAVDGTEMQMFSKSAVKRIDEFHTCSVRWIHELILSPAVVLTSFLIIVNNGSRLQ